MKIPLPFAGEDFRFYTNALLLNDFNDYCRMKSLELTAPEIEQLPVTAKTIMEFANGKKVFAFYAEMGSGKTTLIKELCRKLDSHDNFSSPTYSVVNEYSISDTSSEKIYHIDLFRLKNIDEVVAIGIEEYLNSGNYCFIEWPELIEPLLPDDCAKIYIRCDGNIRNLSIFIN
jgi:tRNA threonylcarbamoyladenosine biosynthesis protein TsaE